ncbi:hypothetical protein AAFC00_002404 [Neodothiora populina]|uniref:Integral membrane protein TmpA n=1 Tax=Neodothiora populina TaxID=2781224 RepID=A0ABR3P8C0_9PEZI
MENTVTSLAPVPSARLADTQPSATRRDSLIRSTSSSSSGTHSELVLSEKHMKPSDIHQIKITEDSTSERDITASKEALEALEDAHPLPCKTSPRMIRCLRWGVFSVYRRLFTLVFTLNLVACILVLVQLRHQGSSIATYTNASTAAGANICVAVLMRNEHVVNVLFRIVCCVPHSAPLWFRRRLAKVYSYGGVHSGCGVAATFWYIAYCGLMIHNFTRGGSVDIGLVVTTGVVLFLLVLILVFAHPYLRMRFHDHFERIHRFAGWTAVAALWAQAMLSVSSKSQLDGVSFGHALIRIPNFWFLIVITCCLVYPWARLRRRSVEAEPLSKHAIRLHFDYREMESCAGVRFTDSALKETHAFATIPNTAHEKRGHSIVIANAGDWTNKIIQNPPKQIWTRGAPTLGVMRVALCFKKVLVIGTGSGIGPCLSFLQSNPGYPVQVIWSAPNPVQNYGPKIMDAVLRADSKAVIVDTKRTGRGNLLALAYALFQESGAEATVIISNPAVTRKVVYGLENRGVPAFGAIFDS